MYVAHIHPSGSSCRGRGEGARGQRSSCRWGGASSWGWKQKAGRGAQSGPSWSVLKCWPTLLYAFALCAYVSECMYCVGLLKRGILTCSPTGSGSSFCRSKSARRWYVYCSFLPSYCYRYIEFAFIRTMQYFFQSCITRAYCVCECAMWM